MTGGPNGIINLDDLSLFGFTATSIKHYLVIIVIMLLVVMTVVHNVDRSRIGRGWRALRENDMAAETMGMPTKRLKLLAFVFGSAIAGLSGAVFAAWQGSVFPNNFAVPLLITLYSIIVLGGLGSIPGVLVGSFVLVVVPELLRDVALASTLFYGAVVLTLAVAIKPLWRAGLVIAAVAALGGLLRLAVPGAPLPPGQGLGALVSHLLILPLDDATLVGNVAFVAVLGLMFVSAYLSSRPAKLVVLVPALWLLALAWQTRLSQDPSVTRLLLIGATLVALMNFRPAGLFGRTRVEVL
jgi:ABC-type branched-subunit amino acid transport system permease subunit